MVTSYSIYDENGELIHELVLCKNSEGRVGWWDTVDGLFRDYTENGAKIPEVDSGSVQYINTGVFLDLQRCDGAGVDPAEYASVCKERDDLKAAFEGAKLSMKALNQKLAQITAERDGLAAALCKALDACDHCKHNGMELPCGGMVPISECDECTLEPAICCKCYAGSCFEFAGVGDVK